MTQRFSDVPWNAPLFNKAPLADLDFIVNQLSKASYHYADDSGQEFGYASLAKMLAAQKANELKLSFSAVERLVKHQPQLVTIGDMIDAMLLELRK
jgi:hypothetical protein